MRRFAQHFLINSHAVERIVHSMELTQQDNVFEIGPGRGVLTALLIPQAHHVTAVEVDADLVGFLKTRFSYAKNFELVNNDILKFDLNGLPNPPYKVVGNLPYNLTSPILRKLSDWTGWTDALIMVQKEVGDRLTARVRDESYGALTVGMNLTCELKPLFELVPTSFKPPPRVHSSVLKLVRRQKPLIDNISGAQRVIQAAFQQRRKTILNSLSHGLKLEKDIVSKILAETKIPETTRPEQIDVPLFVELTKALQIKP
jgi:16S rRNA (adenine1518-N6/adenine1519-N6)-dimethyltransferase